MAGYNEIKGLRVKYLSADPSNAENGQVWYNSTSGNLRVQGIGLQSVTSGSPLITARNGAAGAGIQTAALAFGGDVSPPITNLTEEYNGSGWAVGGTLNTGRKDFGGAGTQTAGLGFGGYISPGGAVNNSEEYNGSSWTEGDNLGTARYRLTGCGTQTAAMALGGRGGTGPSPGVVTTTVENYDGTNWTSGTSFSTARQSGGGAGTNTAALICGGGATPVPAGTTNTANSEEWNGTSWTEGNNMNTTKRAFAGQNGLQTAAIMMGGAPNTTGIETYDGTSWSVSPATLVTQRHNGSGTSGAPGTTGLAVGGSADPGPTASTEEYNSSLNTFTAAAWASGGNLNAARFKMEMNGTQTATIAMGGGTMPSPPLNNSRQRGGAGAFGTQTAAMSVSGVRNPPAPSNTVTDTEEWNGSNWTSGGAVPSGRYSACFFGTQTAGVFAGGNPGPSNTGATDSAEYNGSSFSAGNSMANGRYNATSGGTLTAGLVVMGTAGGSDTANCEEYDGTNYSAGGTSVIADNDLGGSGTQTNFSAFIGPTAQTLIYDGTSWRTDVTALGNVAGTGTSSTTGIVASGNPGTGTTLEYNVGTTGVAPASNLTTS